MPASKVKKNAIEARRRQVAALIVAAITQRKMAETLNVSLGTVNKDIAALMKEWREQRVDDIEQAKLVDLQRIDAMIRAVWPRATSVGSPSLEAMDRLMKLIEMRMRILGYDSTPQLATIQVAPITIVEVLAPPMLEDSEDPYDDDMTIDVDVS